MRLSHSLQSSLSAQIFSAPINAVSLKQFKDVYDTVVLHGIISKSDDVNVQFSTRAVPWIPLQVLFKGFAQVFQYFL